jgi:hypothetical protein
MTQIQIRIDVSPEWLAKNAPEHCAQVLGIMIQQTLENRGKVVGVTVVEDSFSLTPKGLEALADLHNRVQNKREGHGTI